ncbi:uncharacterized protein LOC132972750 isoform X2 [Labrus mixtus]|uniref:uncharacterized protein LOC132972750 isoform X2 n=1 Tax=Labrus mixtus TaxID=508554 RepID=UPI0029C05291|nr:uncharacterized protein LOC132972750 isoform X2 [Labrus mixtus]
MGFPQNTTMALIHSVILFLFMNFRHCQLQCVKALNDREFSINVTTHIQVESGDCIRIPYEIKMPENKVKVPHQRIWFRGDQQNAVSSTAVRNTEAVTEDLLMLGALPRGEYEYGIKLEWDCNQTYIFPTRVRVSVSALTRKPDLLVPIIEEGQPATLSCFAPRLCYANAITNWKLTGTGGTNLPMRPKYFDWNDRGSLTLRPKAYHHNLNITCVAEYENNIVAEKTVTLNVKFTPRILGASQCTVKGKQLVCECISWGNPMSPITWPLAASLTDFSVSSYSTAKTVNSIITIPAADYNSTKVQCISSNELGQVAIGIPIQNTGNLNSNQRQTSTSILLWITAVSACLNLVFITSLGICIWGKRSQKKVGEEMKTYASLNRDQVEPEYSVIPPRLT